MLRRLDNGGGREHQLEILVPSRGVLTRAQPLSFRYIEHGLDTSTYPICFIRFLIPNWSEHFQHVLDVDFINCQVAEGICHLTPSLRRCSSTAVPISSHNY